MATQRTLKQRLALIPQDKEYIDMCAARSHLDSAKESLIYHDNNTTHGHIDIALKTIRRYLKSRRETHQPPTEDK